MDPIVTAALIGAGSSFLGGTLGTFFGGGGSSGLSSEDQKWLADFGWHQSLRNEAFQREQFEEQKKLAEHGLSMRIDEAARYGISPLAALGTMGGSVGGGSFGGPIPVGGGASDAPSVWPGVVNEMGQNISRAVLATKDPYTIASQKLELRRRAKENDLLGLQITNARVQLLKSMGAGIPTAYTYAQNRDGTVSVVPTEEAARSAHAETFGPLMWSIHNGIIPAGEDLGAAVAHYLNVPDVRGERMREADRNARNRP